MTAQQKTMRLMVVAPFDERDALSALIPAHADVAFARDNEEALSLVRRGRFDAVVCSGAALGPALRAAGQQQAQAVLDRLGQGMAVLDRGGQLVWANARLRSLHSAVIEAVREACMRFAAEFEAEPRPRGDAPRARRRTLAIDNDHYFELTVSLLESESTGFEPAGHVLALVADMSAARRLQQKINAIDAAGAELVRLDADKVGAMDTSERLALLENNIVRLSHDLLQFNHFAVRILNRSTNKLETVIAGGMSEEAKALDIYATTEGNGISGFVAATGRSYICPDVSKDPRYLRGIENAASSLTVPLRLYDEVVGILNVESDRIAAFSEDDRQFAEIFGRYIAIALHILKLLAVERRTTIGEISAEVGAELSAPLNDIVTEAATLMEDYIGHDDLRLRLHAIIDTVDRVKRTIQSMTRTTGILGLIPESTPRDPLFENRKILVVEDEDAIRETLANVLTDAGAVTLTAADGDHAVAMIHAQPFDVVISDINMPHRTGYQIFEEAKARNPDCPVIFITGFGYDPEHNILKAARKGLSGVLYKPFKIEKLLDQIRHALTSPGPA